MLLPSHGANCRFHSHVQANSIAWNSLFECIKIQGMQVFRLLLLCINLFVSKKDGGEFLHNLKTRNKPFATDRLYSYQYVPFVVFHFQNPKR